MDIEALIAARPKGRRQQAAWHRDLIEAADLAGISTGDLATRVNCTIGTIYNWRRRLAAVAESSGPPQPTKPGLVQVHRPLAQSLAPSDQGFEVRLARGRSILVPPSFDQGTLTALVEALEQC